MHGEISECWDDSLLNLFLDFLFIDKEILIDCSWYGAILGNMRALRRPEFFRNLSRENVNRGESEKVVL